MGGQALGGRSKRPGSLREKAPRQEQNAADVELEPGYY